MERRLEISKAARRLIRYPEDLAPREKAALEILTSTERGLLFLYFVGGHSYFEICMIAQVSASKVRAMTDEARIKLECITGLQRRRLRGEDLKRILLSEAPCFFPPLMLKRFSAGGVTSLYDLTLLTMTDLAFRFEVVPARIAALKDMLFALELCFEPESEGAETSV